MRSVRATSPEPCAPWRTRAALLSALLMVLCAAPSTAEESVPIPMLKKWETTMVTAGRALCDQLARPESTEQLLPEVYYDAGRVFFQIADYTRDRSWEACARRAQAVYRDQYVIPKLQHGPNNYGVPGYTVFTTGLRMDYERTGDPLSKKAVFLLSLNAAFAPDSTPLDWTVSADYSREVAYAIVSHINAQALGQAPRRRRIDLVNQAYGHMDQWFVNFSWPGPWQKRPKTTGRLAPFMVGLTALTLIRDWEQTQDARLISALQRAADWMWANAWVPANHGFWEDSNSISQGGMPDDDLIIAPLYAFLYWQTGNTKYRDEGDQIFAGGVQYAWNGDGKHFDRSYYWSVDYVKWRTMRPAGR